MQFGNSLLNGQVSKLPIMTLMSTVVIEYCNNLVLYLVSDARVQVVAGGDVAGRGDHREEEREARHRDVHGHYVRRYLLLDVRPENP